MTMGIPNSFAFAARLHEAGLIGDPMYIVSIIIRADGRDPVTISTEAILDDGAIQTLVGELKAVAQPRLRDDIAVRPLIHWTDSRGFHHTMCGLAIIGDIFHNPNRADVNCERCLAAAEDGSNT